MKPIVVDSGPLIMLARGQLLGVARSVAGEIVVPATVFAETSGEPQRPGAAAVIEAKKSGLIRLAPDPEIPASLNWLGSANLGQGEIMVLALAHELGCTALIDDARGRKAAARGAIPVVGSAGLLLAAKEQGLITEVAPILRAWRAWGYFLTPRLLAAVLSSAGENA